MMVCDWSIGSWAKKAGEIDRLVVRRRLALILVLSLGTAALFRVPAGRAMADGQGQCPNEAQRAALSSAGLPDCRAYEMVTPPYKEGYPLFAVSDAANGESAILYSLASLAENPGSSEQLTVSGIYSATRTATGWKLSALNVPLSQFVGQIPIIQAEEADRGETLWVQHKPDQPTSSVGLYARSSTGQYRFIGPLDPNENPAEGPSNLIEGNPSFYDQPVAATADYGKVILESNSSQSRWPAIDKTLGNETRSLYEYTGANNSEPRLVAVEGGPESTQLIGACGATLGAGVGQRLNTYNALSADGERIFFTVAPIEECNEAPAPPTPEIYERVGGSSASAETIHVSADECTETCSPEPSGKNFEGASEDGKLAFFTSTQKLTNNAIDGIASGSATKGRGCARTAPGEPEAGCNLYEHVDGHLVLVARGEVLGVMGVAENGSRVYFVKRTEEKGESEPIERDNLYLYETVSQKTTYIATLSKRDEEDWAREASRRPVELAGQSGQFLLFASSTPGVTTDDTSEVTQLFEYKAEADGEPAELVRVTKGEAGFNQDGNGVVEGLEPSSIAFIASHFGVEFDFKTTTNRLNISTDGHTIIFKTRGELSPRATSSREECTNIYEFHNDGNLSTGTVQLLSDDSQNTQLYKGVTCGAEFQAMDATGDNVLFISVDSLIPGDVDGGQRDIYDARVDGGFIAEATTGGACAGIALCEGRPSGPSALPAAGSGVNAGEAPPTVTPTSNSSKKKAKSKHTQAKKCRRNHVHKHHKCVKQVAKAKRSSKEGV